MLNEREDEVQTKDPTMVNRDLDVAKDDFLMVELKYQLKKNILERNTSWRL